MTTLKELAAQAALYQQLTTLPNGRKAPGMFREKGWLECYLNFKRVLKWDPAPRVMVEGDL